MALEYRIGSTHRGDWKPRFILYVKYGFRIDKNGRRTRHIDKQKLFKSSAIFNFLSNIEEALKLPDAEWDYDGEAVPHDCPSKDGYPYDCDHELGDLDIDVRGSTYVVVELDRRLDWRFRRGGDAITTLEDYGDTNGGLQHVVIGDDWVGHWDETPNVSPCNIAYFGVQARKCCTHQKFSLWVEMYPGKPHKREDDNIYPDVGNNGTKTFPPGKQFTKLPLKL